MCAGSRTFQISPAWCVATTWQGVGVTLTIPALLDRVDPQHCQSLLSRGRWLDDKFV
ncbi:hypothetical protein BDW22DRAFT_1350549, partial [Trametopsis cervina]